MRWALLVAQNVLGWAALITFVFMARRGEWRPGRAALIIVAYVLSAVAGVIIVATSP